MIFTDAQGNQVVKPPNSPVGKRRSAYSIVFNSKKQILLFRPSYNLKWQLPGGGFEDKKDQSLQQTAERECLEETGFTIKVSESKPFFKNKHFFYQRSKNAFYISQVLFFKTQLVSKKQNVAQVTSADKKGQVGWKALKELNSQNTHPIIQPVIDLLKLG